MAIHDSECPGTQMRAALYLLTTLFGQHPEAQAAALRQFARQSGCAVVEEFVDYGAAVAKVRRPALERLMRNAAAISSMPCWCGYAPAIAPGRTSS